MNTTRDDIQRWIAYESRGNENLKNVLKKLAKSWGVNISNSTDRSRVIVEGEKRQKIGFCIEGLLNDKEEADFLVKMMEYFYFDSETRASIHANIKGRMGGMDIFSSPVTQTEKLSICEGL